MAFAMAGTAALPTDKTLALSADWGNFDGHNALTFGAAARVAQDAYLTGGLAVGIDNGDVGGHAGLTVTW